MKSSTTDDGTTVNRSNDTDGEVVKIFDKVSETMTVSESGDITVICSLKKRNSLGKKSDDSKNVEYRRSFSTPEESSSAEIDISPAVDAGESVRKSIGDVKLAESVDQLSQKTVKAVHAIKTETLSKGKDAVNLPPTPTTESIKTFKDNENLNLVKNLSLKKKEVLAKLNDDLKAELLSDDPLVSGVVRKTSFKKCGPGDADSNKTCADHGRDGPAAVAVAVVADGDGDGRDAALSGVDKKLDNSQQSLSTAVKNSDCKNIAKDKKTRVVSEVSKIKSMLERRSSVGRSTSQDTVKRPSVRDRSESPKVIKTRDSEVSPKTLPPSGGRSDRSSPKSPDGDANLKRKPSPKSNKTEDLLNGREVSPVKRRTPPKSSETTKRWSPKIADKKNDKETVNRESSPKIVGGLPGDIKRRPSPKLAGGLDSLSRRKCSPKVIQSKIESSEKVPSKINNIDAVTRREISPKKSMSGDKPKKESPPKENLKMKKENSAPKRDASPFKKEKSPVKRVSPSTRKESSPNKDVKREKSPLKKESSPSKEMKDIEKKSIKLGTDIEESILRKPIALRTNLSKFCVVNREEPKRRRPKQRDATKPPTDLNGSVKNNKDVLEPDPSTLADDSMNDGNRVKTSKPHSPLPAHINGIDSEVDSSKSVGNAIRISNDNKSVGISFDRNAATDDASKSCTAISDRHSGLFSQNNKSESNENRSNESSTVISSANRSVTDGLSSDKSVSSKNRMIITSSESTDLDPIPKDSLTTHNNPSGLNGSFKETESAEAIIADQRHFIHSDSSDVGNNSVNKETVVKSDKNVKLKKTIKKAKEMALSAETSVLEKFLALKPKESRIEKTIKTLRRNSLGHADVYTESKLLRRATSMEDFNSDSDIWQNAAYDSDDEVLFKKKKKNKIRKGSVYDLIKCRILNGNLSKTDKKGNADEIESEMEPPAHKIENGDWLTMPPVSSDSTDASNEVEDRIKRKSFYSRFNPSSTKIKTTFKRYF